MLRHCFQCDHLRFLSRLFYQHHALFPVADRNVKVTP